MEMIYRVKVRKIIDYTFEVEADDEATAELNMNKTEPIDERVYDISVLKVTDKQGKIFRKYTWPFDMH
jgi:hypothetical protein